MDISIIIAAHSEGIIAHKTLLSIKQAVKELKKNGITYEVLATLDRPSAETVDYFERQDVLPVSVLTLDYGDLSASRNHGIDHAKGTYVAIVDADDLISPNWLAKGLELAHSNVVVHTEYSVNFGQASIVWHKKDSFDAEREALRNIDANQWDSAIIASKEILQHFPFKPNKGGLAPEDWHFNCQTLAAGIKHRVAPGTVLYVRRKEVSLMTEQAANKKTLHYTDLFDIDFVKNIPVSTIEAIKTSQKSAPIPAKPSISHAALESAKIAYQQTQKIPGIRRVTRYIRNHGMAAQPTDLNPGIPAWLLEDWRNMQPLETELFPGRDILARTALYDSEMYELGICYWQLTRHITSKPTYILFVPYLTKGGADLVAINYANSIARLDPTQKVLVIATENQPSPWAEKLAAEVDFLPFGEIAGSLPIDAQLNILSTLIIQTKALTLHNIHSHLAFLLLSRYQLFTAHPYTLFMSAFCDDVDNEGRVSGHIHSGLPLVYNITDKVFTDNARVITQLVNEYGYEADRFTTHYQPTRQVKASYKYSDQPFKIIWASRVCKQKRPDILLRIAEQLRDHPEIQIDTYGVLEEGYSADYFASAPNISYKGPFNGLGSILETQKYQLLLYTSERDGMPNILLEAAAHGLPIIAPNVGGVAEIIEDDFLIDTTDGVDQYCKQILWAAQHQKELVKESSRLTTLIKQRHSQASSDSFIQKEILSRVTHPQEL